MQQLEITNDPQAQDLHLLGTALASFNQADVGASDKEPLAVFLRDDAGAVIGGISGYTAWGWLYVQWLFVPQEARGQGLAQAFLKAAEGEARARGCHSAHIDTFSPHGLHAYQKAGYEIFGVLEDFPKGRQRSFLKKAL